MNDSTSLPSHDLECTCFKCKIKSVQISPQATPSRTRVPQKPKDSPSWEKGTVVDGRGMPHLTPGTISPMPIKTYAENRRKIEEGKRRMTQSLRED